MAAPASGRISAVHTGWIIVLLMAGWALFLFLPFGREEKSKATNAPMELPGEAELAAVGLRYNVDWVGLPDFFALWADQARWYQNRTKFAYWNSSSRAYDYFFEATREGKTVRFRWISRAEALGRDEGDYASGYLGSDWDMTEQERAENYPAHPFVFMPLFARSRIYPGRTIVEAPGEGASRSSPTVPVDLSVESSKLQIPAPPKPDVPRTK